MASGAVGFNVRFSVPALADGKFHTSAPPPLETAQSEPDLLDVEPLPEVDLEPPVADTPPPPPVAPAAAVPTKAVTRAPMKYPAMMESGASVALVEGGVEDVDLGPLAPPRFLVPPEVRTSEDVEMRARRFDETFAPLASLTSEDVVIGCSAHGAEYVSQSKEALGKFQSHVRAVDLAHGPSGLVNSLEAGELCQLPIAAASGCVGLSLYSTATVARFSRAFWPSGDADPRSSNGTRWPVW